MRLKWKAWRDHKKNIKKEPKQNSRENRKKSSISFSAPASGSGTPVLEGGSKAGKDSSSCKRAENFPGYKRNAGFHLVLIRDDFAEGYVFDHFPGRGRGTQC